MKTKSAVIIALVFVTCWLLPPWWAYYSGAVRYYRVAPAGNVQVAFTPTGQILAGNGKGEIHEFPAGWLNDPAEWRLFSNEVLVLHGRVGTLPAPVTHLAAGTFGDRVTCVAVAGRWVYIQQVVGAKWQDAGFRPAFRDTRNLAVEDGKILMDVRTSGSMFRIEVKLDTSNDTLEKLQTDTTRATQAKPPVRLLARAVSVAKNGRYAAYGLDNGSFAVIRQ